MPPGLLVMPNPERSACPFRLGILLGWLDGVEEGWMVGWLEGTEDGKADGAELGWVEGREDG
jgi:hypothetical protein